MPLKQVYNIPGEKGADTDIKLAAAHHRIRSVMIDSMDEHVHFTYLIWKNRGAFQSGKAFVGARALDFGNRPPSGNDLGSTDYDDYMAPAVLDAAGVNPIAQAEKWTKDNSPLYVGAVDD